MSITARQTSTRIRAAATLLDSIAGRLPAAVAAIHQAIEDGTDMPERASQGEDAGRRSINSISNPTMDAGLRLAAKHERHFEDIEANLATMLLAMSNLCDLSNRWVNPNVVAPAERCTGGRTVDEWSRPDCANWVAETAPGSGRLRGDGLCDRCRNAKSRWERSQRDQVA